jgi:fused signal recognition particle receptor
VRGLKADDIEAAERVMLEADFGVPATLALTTWLEDQVRKGTLKTENDLHIALRDRIAEMLAGPPRPGEIAVASPGPTVVLFVGVNGVGKTTTVAKLARRLQQEGRSVLLAAADTWRAGAIDQLQVWSDRLGVPCVAGTPGGDPAAVAFDAATAAVSRGIDVVLVDTAGRLHTQDDLMEELHKVTRVLARKIPGAPHEVLLVLDGSVGQNAVQQGRIFHRVVTPTGLVITKLDGTARGGAVIALQVPIRFLGTGEQEADLEAFDPVTFATRLLRD